MTVQARPPVRSLALCVCQGCAPISFCSVSVTTLPPPRRTPGDHRHLREHRISHKADPNLQLDAQAQRKKVEIHVQERGGAGLL